MNEARPVRHVEPPRQELHSTAAGSGLRVALIDDVVFHEPEFVAVGRRIAHRLLWLSPRLVIHHVLLRVHVMMSSVGGAAVAAGGCRRGPPLFLLETNPTRIA